MATANASSTPSQTIELVLPKFKWPLALKLVGFMFWILLTYLVFQLVIVYAENQAVLKWWGRGTGIDKKYNDRFNIWLALCAKQSSTLLFYIIWLFVPLSAHMSFAQIAFVSTVLFKFIRIDDGDSQSGIMIPRHLVESVLLQYTDGDKAFNEWYDKNERTRILTKDNANDPTTAMTWKVLTQTDSYVLYQRQGIPDKNNRIGVYPKSLDREGWKCCIQYWLNGDTDPPVGPWAWVKTAKAQGEGSLYVPDAIDPNNRGNLDEWFDIKKHPDNFLARYGIAPTSPIVVYFANGFYNDDRMTVPDYAFGDLIDGGGGAGGWMGFLQGQPVGTGEDQYKSLIYSTVNYDMASSTPKCNVAARTTLSTAGSLFAGLSGLAFLGEDAFKIFTTGPAAFLFSMSLVSAGITGVQAYQAAKSDKCS
jgi:hypothetical protein